MGQNTFAAGYNFIVKEDHRNGFEGEPVRWSIHMSPNLEGLKELEDGELYFSLEVGTTVYSHNFGTLFAKASAP